jgi:hypothetical protein
MCKHKDKPGYKIKGDTYAIHLLSPYSSLGIFLVLGIITISLLPHSSPSRMIVASQIEIYRGLISQFLFLYTLRTRRYTPVFHNQVIALLPTLLVASLLLAPYP